MAQTNFGTVQVGDGPKVRLVPEGSAAAGSLDIQKLGDGIVEAVRGLVARQAKALRDETAVLEARLAEVERRLAARP